MNDWPSFHEWQMSKPRIRANLQRKQARETMQVFARVGERIAEVGYQIGDMLRDAAESFARALEAFKPPEDK